MCLRINRAIDSLRKYLKSIKSPDHPNVYKSRFTYTARQFVPYLAALDDAIKREEQKKADHEKAKTQVARDTASATRRVTAEVESVLSKYLSHLKSEIVDAGVLVAQSVDEDKDLQRDGTYRQRLTRSISNECRAAANQMAAQVLWTMERHGRSSGTESTIAQFLAQNITPRFADISIPDNGLSGGRAAGGAVVGAAFGGPIGFVVGGIIGGVMDGRSALKKDRIQAQQNIVSAANSAANSLNGIKDSLAKQVTNKYFKAKMSGKSTYDASEIRKLRDAHQSLDKLISGLLNA